MFRSAPFDEDIEKATHENNLQDDWSLIMQVCDKVVNYDDGAKLCFKAILKRLHHNVPRVALQTLTLLDACVKNCDRRFLLLVASSEFTTEFRKLLAKVHPSVATKLKELLQRWSLEEFKDDAELCIIPSLYYKLKSEGVDFPSTQEKKKSAPPVCTDPNVVSSQEEENDIIKAIEISLKDTGRHYPDIRNHNSDLPSAAQPSLPEPFKMRALYDFDAAEDNELTIKTGEIVIVLDNSNANWWKGSNSRGEGLFPANFVIDIDSYPIEEKPAVAAESVDTTFTGKVEINEEKIESCLSWLNDTDPTLEESDPAELLRLEDECYKMAPLIEEHLQTVDKRLMMLNGVNEKIVEAFNLFHHLSENDMSAGTLGKSIGIASSNQIAGMQPLSLQVASPHSSMHPVQSHPEVIQHSLPQPMHYPSGHPSSNPMLHNPAAAFHPAGMAPPTGSSEANPMPGQMPVMLNPYGYPMPQDPGMGNPYVQHVANSGINPAAASPSMMNVPYVMTSMGLFVPAPYYLPNSNMPIPTATTTTFATPTKSAEAAANTKVAASVAVTAIPPHPAYSSELQQIALNSSGQNSKPETTVGSTASD